METFNENELNWIETTSIVDIFINFKLKKDKLYQETLSNISNLQEKYGETNTNAQKVALVDFSSPNIAKPIGVGHLRSTVIGQALANIYSSTGYSVIRDNHLGDWGTQFGELIYAYDKWGDEKEVEKNPIESLKNLYVRFHEEIKENPELKDEARKLFTQLEEKDERLVGLWKKFRDLSIKDFEKTYETLGIKFDTYIGESYFTDSTDEVIENCQSQDVCHPDPETGALVVEDLDKLPSFLIRKKDGSSLYITRDVATLNFRTAKFKPDDIIYVVGEEQGLHFKQFFALAKVLGLTANTNAKHISFGMILADGKKMSTRRGTVIELSELIDQAIEKSKSIIREKSPEINEKEVDHISKIVGIGSIIYNDLRQSRTKNISFDWKRMLSLEGESAVYLQYTYARINSILNKLGEGFKDTDLPENEITLEEISEMNLAKKLMHFPAVINDAQREDMPHLIATYLEETAQAFNSFYNDVSIIKTEDEPLKKSRIMLAKSVATVIKNGLALLNIQVPERM